MSVYQIKQVFIIVDIINIIGIGIPKESKLCRNIEAVIVNKECVKKSFQCHEKLQW